MHEYMDTEYAWSKLDDIPGQYIELIARQQLGFSDDGTAFILPVQ